MVIAWLIMADLAFIFCIADKYSLPVVLNSSVIKGILIDKYFIKENDLCMFSFSWHSYLKELFVGCNLNLPCQALPIIYPCLSVHSWLVCFLASFFFPQRAKACASPPYICHHLVISLQCPPHLSGQVTRQHLPGMSSYQLKWQWDV